MYFRNIPKGFIKVSDGHIYPSGTIRFTYNGCTYVATSGEYVKILDNGINRLLYF